MLLVFLVVAIWLVLVSLAQLDTRLEAVSGHTGGGRPSALEAGLATMFWVRRVRLDVVSGAVLADTGLAHAWVDTVGIGAVPLDVHALAALGEDQFVVERLGKSQLPRELDRVAGDFALKRWTLWPRWRRKWRSSWRRSWLWCRRRSVWLRWRRKWRSSWRRSWLRCRRRSGWGCGWDLHVHVYLLWRLACWANPHRALVSLGKAGERALGWKAYAWHECKQRA